MKNCNFKKIIIPIVIIIIMAPSINAFFIKKSIEIEKTVHRYGRVSGSVFIHCFPPPTYIQGAKLVLESDSVKKTTVSGVFGNFRFNFVSLGKQYTLTVTHLKFKTVVETFFISGDNPDFKISFAMMDKNKIKSCTDADDSACLGSIYGNTGPSHDWSFEPVFFAKVDAGGKTVISSPIMGQYRLNNLPLGTYTIKGSKKGYDAFTDTVTLTEYHPDKQVFVYLEPNDINMPLILN